MQEGFNFWHGAFELLVVMAPIRHKILQTLSLSAGLINNSAHHRSYSKWQFGRQNPIALTFGTVGKSGHLDLKMWLALRSGL